MISVLIADDQALVREGLRMLIKPEPDLRVVGEACDGAEAVTQARRLDPDVLLMDVRMPRVDGIQATAQLARSGCRARILILTTYDLDEYVYRAMKSGACGFLLKDVTREQLTEAVRGVSAGHLLLAPSILQRLIDEFGSPAPAAATAPAADLCLSEATVKSHVARILDRLDLRSRVQIAIFAYEHALVSTERGVRGRGERLMRGRSVGTGSSSKMEDGALHARSTAAARGVPRSPARIPQRSGRHGHSLIPHASASWSRGAPGSTSGCCPAAPVSVPGVRGQERGVTGWLAGPRALAVRVPRIARRRGS